MKIHELKGRLPDYLQELRREQKAKNTIKAYNDDISAFFSWVSDDERELTLDDVISYRDYVIAVGGRPDKEGKPKAAKTTTVNRKVISINKYLKWAGAVDAAGTKQKKTQAKATLDNVITKSEYDRLMRAAMNPPRQALAAGLKQDEQLAMVMKTITDTGIRFSELQYFTVESVKAAKASRSITVYNKGKERMIQLKKQLIKELLDYCKNKGIKSGYVFGTREGNPISNAQLTRRLKKLAGYARVNKSRAHWHNFRHLFAKTYMEKYGRIDSLQSILGHSNINTTTIYTKMSSKEIAAQLDDIDSKPLSYYAK